MPLPEAVPALPAATPWRLFGLGLAGLSVLWLPLAVLHQTDALLAFMTPAELGLDVALLLVLMVPLAAALALVAWASGAVLGQRHSWRGPARNLAWLMVTAPVMLLVAAEFTSSTKHWVEIVLGGRRWVTGHMFQLTVLVLAPVALLLAWRLLGTLRLIRGVIEPLLGLRSLALLMTVVAGLVLLWRPPVVNGHSTGGSESRASANDDAPDVFLITMDTLSADDAGVCGSGPTTMPHLRLLAARSTCFERFYASANQTRSATSAIETGALPWTHWAVNLGGQVAPALRDTSLGAALQRAGYTTRQIGAVQAANAQAHGTYRGYDSVDLVPSKSVHTRLSDGLSTFTSSSLPIFVYLVSASLGKLDLLVNSRQHPYPPTRVYDKAFARLSTTSGAKRPTFMWLHTMPPHSPYLPPPSTKYKLLPPGQLEQWSDFLGDSLTYSPERQPAVDKQRLRYRETVMGADEALGTLLDGLEKLGRLDKALVIVSADHGESFERGWLGHAGEPLTEPVLRVPLVVKLPYQRTARTVAMPVSQVDLANTVLDLVGAEPLRHSDGRSIRPLLLGQGLAPLPIFAMTMARQSRYRSIDGGHYTVIDGRHKLVYHPKVDAAELYDVEADPHTAHDLAAEQPQTTQRLRLLLQQRLAKAEAQRHQWFGGP